MGETYQLHFGPVKIADDSLLLARKMHDNGYHPDALLGIWRGGAAVAVGVSGGLNGYGAEHLSFSASGKSYGKGMNHQTGGIIIFNMEERAKDLQETGCKRICLVDDVFDTGRTGHAFLHILRNGLRIRDAIKIVKGTNGYDKYHFLMKAANDEYVLTLPLHGDRDIDPTDAEVKIATPYWKPHANKTEHVPDFYVEKVEIDSQGRWPWIVFWWEGPEDLSRDQLKQHFPSFHSTLYE